jgi:hypothetical protein
LREAIEGLSRGWIEEGFDELDNFGLINEIADDAGKKSSSRAQSIVQTIAIVTSTVALPNHLPSNQPRASPWLVSGCVLIFDYVSFEL